MATEHINYIELTSFQVRSSKFEHTSCNLLEALQIQNRLIESENIHPKYILDGRI